MLINTTLQSGNDGQGQQTRPPAISKKAAETVRLSLQIIADCGEREIKKERERKKGVVGKPERWF